MLVAQAPITYIYKVMGGARRGPTRQRDGKLLLVREFLCHAAPGMELDASRGGDPPVHHPRPTAGPPCR